MRRFWDRVNGLSRTLTRPITERPVPTLRVGPDNRTLAIAQTSSDQLPTVQLRLQPVGPPWLPTGGYQTTGGSGDPEPD